MKNIIEKLTLLTFTIILLFTGCQKISTHKLIGMWKRDANTELLAPHFSKYINFQENGIVYTGDDANNLKYWYEYKIINNSKIEVKFGGNESNKKIWLYSLNENILTINDNYACNSFTKIN